VWGAGFRVGCLGVGSMDGDSEFGGWSATPYASAMIARHARALARTLYPYGGLRPFRQKSICLAQLTLGPYVLQIWSCYLSNCEGTNPSHSIVW